MDILSPFITFFLAATVNGVQIINQDKFVMVYGPNKRSTNSVISNIPGISMIECGEKCLRAKCGGFNFQPDVGLKKGTCHVIEKLTAQEDMDDAEGFLYYQSTYSTVCSPLTLACYIYGKDLSHQEALEKCPKLHTEAKLTDVSSETEQKILEYIGDLLDDDVWTSGIRTGGQHDFVWLNTGEALTYTNWIPGEPQQGAPTSNCIILTKTRAYQWNDYVCENEKAYACKIGPQKHS